MLASRDWKLPRSKSEVSTVETIRITNEWNHMEGILLYESDDQRKKLSVLCSDPTHKLSINDMIHNLLGEPMEQTLAEDISAK